MRKLFIAGIAAALALTGCAGNSANTDTESATDRSYDVSSVQKVDEIANLVPDAIASEGKLVVGAAIDYAPAEFRADDLQTAIGYDMDLAKAIGKVMGLETEISAAEFASLVPGIGSKYNVGISSFTVTEERTSNFNMIAYIMVGSEYSVQKDNPKGFDPDNPCGTAIGVQTGTAQEDEMKEISAQCEADGKEAIDILSYGVQSDVTTNVAGGKIDATYTDSTVAEYSSTLTEGQVVPIGGVRASSPQGIMVDQNDAELTEAVQKAMQHLMDDGTWNKILESWGIDTSAALTTADLYPKA